jgi:hypothetical protein
MWWSALDGAWSVRLFGVLSWGAIRRIVPARPYWLAGGAPGDRSARLAASE